MQKSNTTKYLVLSAVFIFASIKKVYAETEINPDVLQDKEILELEVIEPLHQETLLKHLLTKSESTESDHEKLDVPHQEQLPHVLYPEPTTPLEQHNNNHAESRAASKDHDPFTQGLAEAIAESESTVGEHTNQTIANHDTQTEIIVLPILTSDQQEQVINAILNGLSPQEQVQFIEILEGSSASPNSSEKASSEKTSLEKIMDCFDSCRCLNFCLKLSLAILFWEVIQKLDIVENNKLFPKSAQELFKALTTVLFVDDIKDFVKEIKKAVEGECSLLYRNFYSK